MAAYQAALRHNPALPHAYECLGLALRQVERLEDAKARVAADVVTQKLKDQITRPAGKAPPANKT